MIELITVQKDGEMATGTVLRFDKSETIPIDGPNGERWVPIYVTISSRVGKSHYASLDLSRETIIKLAQDLSVTAEELANVAAEDADADADEPPPKEVGVEWINREVGPGLTDLCGLIIGPRATDAEIASAVERVTRWAIEDGFSPQWTDEEAAARIRALLAGDLRK